jgi:VCBS repeat-containing protein
MSTRYFLALNGVKGDSLNSTYRGWFEVSEFDIDLASAGAGTTAFSPLTLTLGSNSGLAPLLAMAATGETLNGATLVGVNDAGQQVYHLDLADVLVTNVEHHAEGFSEGGPTLTLGYGQIELETFTPDGTGGVVPEGHFGGALPSADPGGSVAATPEGRPIDYFMLIPGLNGGSLDLQHKGWFEITGVDLDMEKLAAGDFASLNVTVPGAVDLPELFKMAMTGGDASGNGVITGVHIEGITRVGATPTKVYDLTLANVRVSNLAVTHAAGSETLDYNMSLDYRKIALVTNGIDGSGKPVKNGEFGYDVANHTEIAPFSLGLTPGDGLSSFGGGTRYFLRLDGVDGDWRVGSDRCFEVNSLDIDLEGTGHAGKKSTWSPLTLTLDSNAALAPLLTKAATGQFFKDATLIGVRADGEPVMSQLNLALVFVTKVDDVAGGGLTVNLDVGALTIQQFTVDRFGDFHSPTSDFQWDRVLNLPEYPDEVSLPGGGTIDRPDPITAAGVSIVEMPSSPEPASYFMLIDGLNGGSTDPSHQGWFEITGLDLGLTNPANIGGGSAGKASFSSLNVTLPNEAALADVMNLAATGTLVKGVRIEGFTDGTTPAKVYELSLGDVLATKVVDGEDGGYSLSLDYGKIALVTKTETGTQARQFSYDIETNSPDTFNPSSLVLNPGSSGGPVIPAKYFLALDGVKGDSLDANHKGWFEISGFDFDLENTSSIGSAIGGGATVFSPLTLTLNSNTALAPLLELAATGRHLNGATLVGVTAAGEQAYRLDLADVRATKVEDDAGAGLTLSLGYGKIELETFTQAGPGIVRPAGRFGFDQTANADGITVPSVHPGGTVDPSPPPATYFMLIDGVNGGSTDASHRGWFEISGFDLDLAHATVPGGGTGTAAFSPLNVTLPHETRLADVMALLATGEHVRGVHIEGMTAGAQPGKIYDLTLADVQVTKVADSENDGYGLSLDYGKISLLTNGIDQTGRPSQNGEFAYDVANDVGIVPFTLNLSPNGNQAPTAVDDSAFIKEDASPNQVLGNVLANDQDADGDALTVTSLGTFTLAHGSLVLNADGSYAYTLDNSDPAVNALGDGETLSETFTYSTSDGKGGTDTAELTVTIQGATDNSAPTVITGTESDDQLSGLGGQDFISGGGGNDMLDSGAGDDTLDGGTGNDVMRGGLGDDSYVVDSVLDAVIENAGEGTDTVNASIHYALTADVENLVLQGDAATSLQGYGNAQANHLTGSAGANLLDGLGGADTMAGGLGNDVYFADDALDFVVENSGEGNDAVFSSVDYTLAANIETLILRGVAGLKGTGNNLDNAIYGNSGNNILDGGTGADALFGGVGDDSYFVDGGDGVIEKSGEGRDTVIASIDYALAANVENLVLQGDAATSLQGYGNELINFLTGSDGDNLLNGLAGADRMAGGLGNDVYFVDDPGDQVIENPGGGSDAIFSTVSRNLEPNVETLVLQGAGNLSGDGNTAANKLYGNDGDNRLNGQSGADVLNGGAGRDTLIGGAGNDTFVFVAGQADGDIVVDFDDGGLFGTADTLKFVGYGAGATLTQTDAAHWQVNFNGGASHEVITFQNLPSIQSFDVLFV